MPETVTNLRAISGWTCVVAAALLMATAVDAQLPLPMMQVMQEPVRLKDVARVQTAQDLQLLGYGLVVGLEGAGDGRGAPYTTQALSNLMRNMGVEVDPQQIRAKNAAAVMVTATLSPFDRVGSTIDVTVSSVGDAGSLEGGILLMTPLSPSPSDGPIVAVAQGPVSIGGFNVQGGGGGSITKNHPVVGRVPNGAIVQQEMVAPGEVSSAVSVLLRDPDYTTAARLGRSVDAKFGARIARALDAGTVRVDVPRSFQTQGEFIEFLAILETVEVIPDINARVVVNERTGTIVAGQHVKLLEVAIAHGNLSISVGPEQSGQISAPGLTTEFQAGGQTSVEEENPRILSLPAAADVSQVAQALNALKVTPRDIIAIFQALKRAGALQAELIIL